MYFNLVMYFNFVMYLTYQHYSLCNYSLCKYFIDCRHQKATIVLRKNLKEHPDPHYTVHSTHNVLSSTSVYLIAPLYVV